MTAAVRSALDVTQITDQLYVGAQPPADAAAALRALNIGLIISMRAEARPPAVFSQPPLSLLWLSTWDSFFIPIPLKALERGARAALPVLERGQAVLAHCHRGRHRGVAMGAAILIAQGATAADAMQLLRERRDIADPDIWHIRRQIVRFERRWRTQPYPARVSF